MGSVAAWHGEGKKGFTVVFTWPQKMPVGLVANILSPRTRSVRGPVRWVVSPWPGFEPRGGIIVMESS